MPGEHVDLLERLVVSPTAGIFTPIGDVPEDVAAAPRPIGVGDALGIVATVPVESSFAGWLMGMLAVPGERVQIGQPIAWLRTEPV